MVISSDILSGKTTAKEEESSEPDKEEEEDARVRPVDMHLGVADVTDKSAVIRWRFFTAEERALVDGVQVRYIAMDSSSSLSSSSSSPGVPQTSPFLHRDTNFFVATGLDPDTEYEVDLYLIPAASAVAAASAAAGPELVSSKEVAFKTRPRPKDPFDVDLLLRLESAGGSSVRLSWSGIPPPRHSHAALYRILFSEHHVNEVEAAESVYIEARPGTADTARLEGLRTGTRYQIWMEAYLRNGKVARSNVLDVTTTSTAEEGGGASAAPSKDRSSKDIKDGAGGGSGSGDHVNGDRSYYNSMVLAWIIAAFALLALVIVTVLYLRRTTTYKAIISGNGQSSNGAAATSSSSSSHGTNPKRRGRLSPGSTSSGFKVRRILYSSV